MAILKLKRKNIDKKKSDATEGLSRLEQFEEKVKQRVGWWLLILGSLVGFGLGVWLEILITPSSKPVMLYQKILALPTILDYLESYQNIELSVTTYWLIPPLFGWLAISGLLLGVLIGLLTKILLANFISKNLRLTSYFGLGMFLGGAILSGFIIWFKAQPAPMDWRIVLVAGSLGTLPGALLGWLAARFVSQAYIEQDKYVGLQNWLALWVEKPTLETKYPYSSLEIQGNLSQAQDKDLIVHITLIRSYQDLEIFIWCPEDYPNASPYNPVLVKIANNEERKKPIANRVYYKEFGFDSNTIYNWDSEKNQLIHIIDELLSQYGY